MSASADIAANFHAVRRRIDAAARRSHRSPSDIQLVAVSKTFSVEDIRAAVRAGQRHFGENRVQEGLAKIEALASDGLEWHLIGHLQSNKAKRAAAAFTWIESVDSLDLLSKIDRAAVEQGTRPTVLIQVDLAHEATKHGASVEEVPAIVSSALEGRAVRLVGLMIVPPYSDDPEESRPWFRRLRELRDDLVARGTPAASLAELSMGMSHDFEIAIEEGATVMRVGTAIFGARTPGPADEG